MPRFTSVQTILLLSFNLYHKLTEDLVERVNRSRLKDLYTIFFLCHLICVTHYQKMLQNELTAGLV